MGLFDTILDTASDYLGDDGDEMVNTFRGFFSGDDDGGGDSGSGWGSAISSFLGGDSSNDSDGGSSGWGSTISSFLGGGSDGDSGGSGWGSAIGSFLGGDSGNDGGDGGWAGMVGGLVDRLSGDGGREDLWDRALDTVVDRVSPYLPEEVRSVAGQLFDRGQGAQGQDGQGAQGSQGSSWVGSLVDTAQTSVPNGWHAVANHSTAGNAYGEAGFGGFADQILANIAGNHAAQPGHLTAPPVPGGTIDPAAVAAAANPLSTPYAGAPGDDDGIRYFRAPDIEPGQPLDDGTDGDGMPDPRVTMPADAVGQDRYTDTDTGTETGDDQADYDDLVTSGAAAPEPGYEAPHDPTFPVDDPGTAAVADPAAPVAADQPDVAAPPADDFQQSIDDADQVDESMDTMFEGIDGIEGPV